MDQNRPSVRLFTVVQSMPQTTVGDYSTPPFRAQKRLSGPLSHFCNAIGPRTGNRLTRNRDVAYPVPM